MGLAVGRETVRGLGENCCETGECWKLLVGGVAVTGRSEKGRELGGCVWLAVGEENMGRGTPLILEGMEGELGLSVRGATGDFGIIGDSLGLSVKGS